MDGGWYSCELSSDVQPSPARLVVIGEFNITESTGNGSGIKRNPLERQFSFIHSILLKYNIGQVNYVLVSYLCA